MAEHLKSRYQKQGPVQIGWAFLECIGVDSWPLRCKELFLPVFLQLSHELTVSLLGKRSKNVEDQ